MSSPSATSVAIKSEVLEDSPDSALGTVKLHNEETNTIAEAAAVVADEALDSGNEVVQVSVLANDEASALKGLTADVRNQDDLERDITHQANLVMIEQEDDRDRKRIEKVDANIEKLQNQKRLQERRMNTLANNPLMRRRVTVEIERIEAEILGLHKDKADIQGRIDERHQLNEVDGGDQEADDTTNGNKRLPNESQREFLIRTGKITPFSKVPDRGPDGLKGDLSEVLMDAEDEANHDELRTEEAEPRSHQNLRLPGFASESTSSITTPESEFSLRPRKKRKIESAVSARATHIAEGDSADAFSPDQSEVDEAGFIEDEEAEEDDLMTSRTSKKRPAKKGKSKVDEKVDLTGIDDGNEQMYQSRLRDWVEKRSSARRRKQNQEAPEGGEEMALEQEEKEWFMPCPDAPDHHFENDIKLPGDIYPALFDYQKTGVQWLGELYNQQVGGIVGDEMGLGKTIQIISFLAGLHYSKKLTKPIIVVAPATVLRQWVNEFHRWWPPLRVSILHSSGSGMLNVRNEDDLDEEEVYSRKDKSQTKSSKAAKKIVDRVVKHGHVLVTTYAGLQTYNDVLIPVDWGYAVLDEGHKIRNPNTAITIYCKELRTSNRIILSGTPMQNNLIELWSLFDFVFPMRLGTLVNFRQSFEVPIKLGGYANATNLQVMTATKCAETLKAAISPYLLQRLKVDVAADLPKKSEQVLFCKLTKPQREAYELFLASDDMTSILNRTRQSLYGIDILRKICNHPDLLDPHLKDKPGYKWGNPNKSGKMQVVKALLEMWKNMGHKTLLFSQGVQMLNIIEEFVKGLDGFNYLRMDGSTNIKDRQSLVDRFNKEPDLHVFLLTTKVGGLGVNLTGANRVIIFDPDWNPSTDVQARERAWRLGQKKEVTIYRLMTAGTIEEKIYHRQIFKQFLTNKILKDPKQRQTFQMKDLYDLFTLGGADDDTTETGEMFKGTEVQFGNEPRPTPNKEVKRPVLMNPNSMHVPTLTADGTGISRLPLAQAQVTEEEPDTDVRNLTGVASLETFRGNEDEERPTTDEARLMEGIFARSGVHSALEHDHIINGKKVIAADRGMLEREAKRVAAEAAAELRKAGVAARSIEAGTVTWTGEFGSAGRPANIRRGVGGPSSAGILAGLADRQGLPVPSSSSSSRSGTPGTSERAPRGKDFMKLIREFIKRHGGSVPSQALVTHFDRMCRTAQQTAEFKHMLGEIAKLEKGPNSRMRGRWVLKDEFK
ncbi:putative DNA repair and recombination protein RAD26 [Coleophoma cylindrospora]|uniref:Putative DNA repair and recombination protein RAD26 n=1 Tax=Coleophoma cylindrospora TaxID=1849047 RepID=A0A3D8STA2_9HELO|nr:putative DNA repair and recombination protein RAD26 [Coleophoma cylindrospora]